MIFATFNLKDFFSPKDPSNLSESFFFQRRISEFSEKIWRSGASVVAVQEIGDEAALRALATNLGPDWQPYCGIPDERNIRVGFLCKLHVKKIRSHLGEKLLLPRFYLNDPEYVALSLRRPFLSIQVECKKLGLVDLLTLHLKSKLPLPTKNKDGHDVFPRTRKERAHGYLRSHILRTVEALYAREICDSFRRTNAPFLYAVLGDFNDGEDSITANLIKGVEHSPEETLHSALDDISEEKRFSFIYRGKKMLLDHILLSTDLMAKKGRANIDNDELKDHSSVAPFRSQTVESDHALVQCTFI